MDVVDTVELVVPTAEEVVLGELVEVVEIAVLDDEVDALVLLEDALLDVLVEAGELVAAVEDALDEVVKLDDVLVDDCTLEEVLGKVLEVEATEEVETVDDVVRVEEVGATEDFEELEDVLRVEDVL